jgi:DNA-binding CsgD family transcriptional regulator
VSFFTARNHVERLLAKLGATNRAHVGTLLRDA